MPDLITLNTTCFRNAVPARPASRPGEESPPPATIVNFALISLEVNPAVSAPGGSTRSTPGGEIVLVLDRSGSMYDTAGPEGIMHIQRVVEAAKGVARALGPDDRLAIYAFDHRLEQICELTPGSQREQILAALAKFDQTILTDHGGGTWMAPAIRAGMQEIRERARNHLGARLVILTDGMASDPDDALSFVRTLEGQSVAALGFGEFDFAFMSEVCASGGDICEVLGEREPSDVEQLFMDQLQVAQNTVASNLVLRVTPSATVSMRSCYRTQPSAEFLGAVHMGREAVYERRLPAFEQDRGMQLVLDFEIQPDPRREPGRLSVMEVELVYDSPAYQKTGERVIGNVVVECTPDSTKFNQVDNSVREAYQRGVLAELMDRVQKSAMNGQAALAIRTLDTMINLGDEAQKAEYQELRAKLMKDHNITAKDLMGPVTATKHRGGGGTSETTRKR